MIQHALIMAAGRGLRMMPLTEVIPKAMAPFNGSTLIANGIEKINKHIPYVHITVGYKGAMLAQHVIGHKVSSVFNTEGKGNSWWIFNTLLKNLNEPIFVLTCDNVTDIDFEELSAEYYRKKAPPCMIIPVTPVKGLEGDYIFKEGCVIYQLDRKVESTLYCSGIQILNPYQINQLIIQTDDFSFVWSQLIEKKLLLCSDIEPHKWYTVDNLDQLGQLQV